MAPAAPLFVPRHIGLAAATIGKFTGRNGTLNNYGFEVLSRLRRQQQFQEQYFIKSAIRSEANVPDVPELDEIRAFCGVRLRVRRGLVGTGGLN